MNTHWGFFDVLTRIRGKYWIERIKNLKDHDFVIMKPYLFLEIQWIAIYQKWTKMIEFCSYLEVYIIIELRK